MASSVPEQDVSSTQHALSTQQVDIITSTPSESNFLKMEDLHTSASPAPSTHPESSPAPNTVYVQSKPAKKRKSWGQQLPQPKTSLPPRKRAKTDDEKEQRRIERIKRNRAAAHNSRERKRQETETLAVALAKANAKLDAYRKLHGPLPASIILPDVQLSIDSSENITTIAVTPAPSLVDSHGSQGDSSSPKSPDDDIFNHNIKQEPQEHSFPILPAYETLDSKSAFLPLDQTQHSAVSVQQQEQQLDFASFLVEQSHPPLSDDFSAPDMLPHSAGGTMDTFAFTDGAYDASLNGSLFSFDDLIDDSATFAVDAQTSGAA